MKGVRTEFDQDDDALLVKYIAVHNPAKSSRSGNALYRLLVQNAENKWPWSQRHSWQSWRAHYRSKEHKFDYEIKRYQKKHGITVDDDPKQYTTRPHAWKTAWITTQGSSVVKNMDIHDDSDAGTDSENAITIVRSAESNARKSAARKTVNASQRTEPDAGSVGIENAKSSVEILSGPSNRSAKEREGADIMKATQKRRSADEYEGNDVGSKRRKVEEEPLRTKSSGQATEDVQEAKASGMRKGEIEEEESAADVEMRDDHETAKGTKVSEFPTNHQPVSKAPHSDEFKSALKTLSSHLNTARRNLIFEELGLDVQTQDDVLKSLKPPSPQLDKASLRNEAATVDYRPLYPDLSEFKEVDRPEPKSSQVPGAWDVDRDAVPTPPAEDTAGTESQRKENATARSPDFHSPKHPSSSPSVPVQRGFVSRPPRRKINNHEDFFVSPPLTPTKSVSPQQHPSTPPQTSTSNPQNETEARISNSTSLSAVAPASTLPKRDPPRIVNGAFKGTYAHVNGRMASYKRAPDLDSDSDSSINTESKIGTRTSAAASIWPPPREKRSRKSEEAPVPASSPKRKDINALEQTKGKSDIAQQKRVQLLNKEKSAPLALSVTKAYKRRESAGGRPAMLASAKDKTHPELFHPQPEPEPQAGPSRIQASNPPPATVEKAAEIDAWRMKTPASEVPVSSVSTASASDPFVTTNLANRLRKEEKDKKKEKMDASANRRMTFGGFSALPTDIPEIDLRKKRFGRNSLAADPTTLAARRSLSTSNSLFAKQKEHLSSRRTSLASTIDLTAEFPSPGAPIAPADQVLVNRVGLHFFVQAMAENHGLTEDWVRRVYNERRDLPGTDRVLSKIRAAAERALDEALEREKGIIDMNGNKHVSDTERLPVKRRSRHSLGARSHVDDFREREIDSSLLHDQSASNSRQRHVLLYTPAEADKTLARARERYVPPSASRAAKYMRKRMRESSGMSSPLKPSVDAGVELKVRDDSGDDDDDNDKEEEEVSMSLTRPQTLADVFRNIGGASVAQGTPTPASAPVMNGSNLKIQRPLDILQRPLDILQRPTGLYKSSSWTAEEDAVLSRGEDNPEMRAIIEKRGQAAIKQRAIELLMRDDDLFS